MAKVLGESGRYLTKQMTKMFQRQILILFAFLGTLMFGWGYLLGANKVNSLTIPFSIIAVFLGTKWLNKKLAELESARINFRKGAVGEAVIGYVLESFPDNYRVVHDLTTPFGNIDHIVVGPTGAYVIDTKNWKGTVRSDSNGELLVNGKPTDKQEIKKLTRRIMNIRDKIKVLSSMEPFIQGIFAFPSARIEARWGTTGYVHCMSDDALYAYIVETKKTNTLSKKEIETISQAFLALARMDKSFE